MPWNAKRVARLIFITGSIECLGMSVWAGKKLFGNAPTLDDARLFCAGIVGIPLLFLAYRVIVVAVEGLEALDRPKTRNPPP